MRMLRTVGLALALVLSAGVAGADDWYLLLDGQSGPISAHSGTVVSGLTDQTEILSYGQNFFLPLDSMGTPGPLQFRPLRVVKAVDGSSPRIAEALANGETITCVLTLYQLNPTTPVYEYQLITPRIIGVSGGGATPSADPGAETVSILFQSIKITDLVGGQTTTIP